MEIPAFIEVTPDDFKPLGDCSRSEILDAAELYMGHALMGAREAVAAVEADGVSPISEEAFASADEHQRLAKALMDYAAEMN